jgi:hypothetical protein
MRQIKYNSKKIKFEYITKDNENENCHMGQKKLLFSEIEFLNNVSKYVNLYDCLFIYVGASPGAHINIIKKLFPDIYFLLYDMGKIEMDFEDNLIIFDGENGFFNDSKINYILELKKKLNKKYILYVSDIRTSESVKDELSLWNNMIDQQRWGIKLDADFMLLKFRLPWLNKYIKDDYLNYTNDLSKFKDKIKINNNILENGDILYLKGKIFTQIYSTARSSETRLFVKKKNNKYKIKKYNCYDYEDKLTYYNIHTRDKKIKFKKSNTIQDYLLGYNNKYESVSEYYIIYKYLKYYKKNLSNYNHNIIKILFDISFKYSNYLFDKFNVFCIFYSYINYISSFKNIKKLSVNNIDSKYIDKLKNTFIIIKNELNKYINNFIKYELYINNQIIKLKLNKDNLDFMINKIINNKIIYSFNNNKYILNDYIDNKFIININAIKEINELLINSINKNPIFNNK